MLAYAPRPDSHSRFPSAVKSSTPQKYSSSSLAATLKRESAPTSGSASSVPSLPPVRSALPSDSFASSGSSDSTDFQLRNSGSSEAQWILSVLDDTTNKLILSSLLTPELLKEKFLESADPELLIALREHFHVEEEYRAFQTQIKNSNTTAEEREKHAALQAQLDLCLSDSTRTVTRLLKTSPQIAAQLQAKALSQAASAAPADRIPSVVEFLNVFSRLRLLMLNSLRLTAEEEKAQKSFIARLKSQEQEDTAKFLELTERLAIEKSEHEESLTGKDRKIQRLQLQIDSLKGKYEAERAAFEKRMREENEQAEKLFKNTEKELLKQLEALQSTVENEGSENFRNELAYHRRKNLRAQDVTTMIDKYDNHMETQFQAINDLKAVYEREQKELKELTKYFERVDLERAIVAKEREAIRERREMQMREARETEEADRLLGDLFKLYYAKNGPKEPKKKKKPKKYKPMWRPPRENKQSRPNTQGHNANAESDIGEGNDSVAQAVAFAAAAAADQNQNENTDEN